jgi:PIN domain nuclease of toxin-antitoxin system
VSPNLDSYLSSDIWVVSGDARLPAAFRDAVRDPANEVYLSVASVWEVAIKYGLGKLPLPAPPEDYLPKQRERHGVASLPIEEATLTSLAKLPLLHRDPFDRILVAQALQHDLTVVTVDNAVRAYPVKLLPPN